MQPLKIIPVSMAIIQQDDKFLLTQESKSPIRGLWHIPGGRHEPGESIQALIRREVLEETGIEVELIGLLHFGEKLDFDHDPPYHRFSFLYLARPIGGTLKKYADEHSLQADWFTLDEIKRLPLRWTNLVKRLESVLNYPPLLPVIPPEIISVRG